LHGPRPRRHRRKVSLYKRNRAGPMGGLQRSSPAAGRWACGFRFIEPHRVTGPWPGRRPRPRFVACWGRGRWNRPDKPGKQSLRGSLGLRQQLLRGIHGRVNGPPPRTDVLALECRGCRALLRRSGFARACWPRQTTFTTAAGGGRGEFACIRLGTHGGRAGLATGTAPGSGSCSPKGCRVCCVEMCRRRALPRSWQGAAGSKLAGVS